ncbi:MAG TPA: hypothetical protein VMT85_25140, partial [Thermoanaerobaculia bacterium]|nr:hypothetical protein [Thermoanaerobaculia bacterium]
ALNLLGAIAERREDLPAAIGFYERGLELEPGSIPLRARLADTLARQDEGQRALAIYELLIEDGALDADAERLYKAAMLNTRYGDPARAEGLFRRGLALAPGGVHHLSMAFILNRNGKLGEGIEHLELVLERYRADLSPQQAQLAARTLEQWRRSL